MLLCFPRTQMWLRHDRLMIVLRPSATRHKFWLCTGFATGRPPEHPPGRPLQYRIQAMGKRWIQIIKNTRPRMGPFSTSRGSIEAMSFFWVWRREAASESEAACELRPATGRAVGPKTKKFKFFCFFRRNLHLRVEYYTYKGRDHKEWKPYIS